MDANREFQEILHEWPRVRQVAPKFALSRSLHSSIVFLKDISRDIENLASLKDSTEFKEKIKAGGLRALSKEPKIALASRLKEPVSRLMDHMNSLRRFLEHHDGAENLLRGLNAYDRKFMMFLRQKGYLDRPPLVTNDFIGFGALVYDPNDDDAGHVFMFNKPSAKALQGGRMIKKSDNKSSAEIYERLFTLCHEAAHTRFAVKQSPFCPSVSLSADPEEHKKIVDAINSWVVPFGGRGEWEYNSDGAPQFASTLNEAFADTYAFMMLLKESGFSQEAFSAAKSIQAFRSKDSVNWMNYLLLSREPKMKDEFFSSRYGGCAPALQKLLDTVDDWKDLSPKEIEQKAYQIASDGVLEYFDVLRDRLKERPVLRSSLTDGIFQQGQRYFSIGHAKSQMLSGMLDRGVDSITEGRYAHLPAFSLLKNITAERIEKFYAISALEISKMSLSIDTLVARGLFEESTGDHKKIHHQTLNHQVECASKKLAEEKGDDIYARQSIFDTHSYHVDFSSEADKSFKESAGILNKFLKDRWGTEIWDSYIESDILEEAEKSLPAGNLVVEYIKYLRKNLSENLNENLNENESPEVQPVVKTSFVIKKN